MAETKITANEMNNAILSQTNTGTTAAAGTFLVFNGMYEAV